MSLILVSAAIIIFVFLCGWEPQNIIVSDEVNRYRNKE